MTISIIDDHKMLSEVLKFSLQRFDFVEAVNLYTEPEKFFAHMDLFPTNILITDMLMPGTTGIEIIKSCRKTKSKSELKIIVLSGIGDVNVIKKSFAEGANGYISKDASITELVEALKTVFDNENAIYVGDSLKDILVEFQLFEKEKIQLAPHHLLLLKHVCQGETVKEIAHKQNLSVAIVQRYLKQLMRKMNVNRTPDLILKAIKQGLFLPIEIN